MSIRNPDTFDRDSLVKLARISEHCERYEDTVEFIKALARKAGELTIEEINLLSLPYMCLINQRKTSIRIIDSVLKKSENKENLDILTSYKQNIKEEIIFWCEDQITLISWLLEFINNEDPRCLTYKMLKAHRYRDLIEVENGDRKESFLIKAKENYTEWSNLANSLCPTHSQKLGMALNLASFYYEIEGNRAAALEVLNQTIISAEEEISRPLGLIYSDTASTLKILKDTYNSFNSEETI
ncbi:unnamed protein product [Blepharisma stoltei]|uniref:14-3-3 domain-containing protein n=1 Tax=Blepharisma stoltei TaxID=1481888 RepID=A0AAU9IL00_9CILI|nr:unnamed protein product [Blepharisma stoltei]